jgi:palmitoyltransferase ZDHHC9/14/18
LLIGAQDNSTVADAIRDTPATLVEAIVCFFSIWSVIGLWGYHTYLICRSVTTNEDVSI